MLSAFDKDNIVCEVTECKNYMMFELLDDKVT